MTNAKQFLKELQTMKAADVVRNEQVKEQFITVYNHTWNEGGEAVYEREAMYFNRILAANAKLLKATGLSTYYAFIDLAVRGLTLEPGAQALCYLTPESYKTGVDAKGNNIYEQQCKLTVSGYGELLLRQKYGQIRYADNPVIVYECDQFQHSEQNGVKNVNYVGVLPRTSTKIVACFLKITRADGSIDYAVMLPNDWERLKGYSEKKNSYYDEEKKEWVKRPNTLYNVNGQIDQGFLIAKCIKHAFKTYPKLPIGRGTIFETEVIDKRDNFDPYAIPGDAEHEQPEEQPAPEPQHFAPAPDTSRGITVESNDETF